MGQSCPEQRVRTFGRITGQDVVGGANSGELSAFLTSAWDISASDIVVALISLILETGKLARANISLDTGLVADIDEAAARRGVTRSAFLATAARDRIRAGA